jgi:hypothetical protein
VQVGTWAAVWSLGGLNGEGRERDGEGIECRVAAAIARARGLAAWVATGRLQGARARWSVGRVERLAVRVREARAVGCWAKWASRIRV